MPEEGMQDVETAAGIPVKAQDTLPQLLSMLEDGDAQVRGMIAVAFADVDDDRVTDPLISLLADEDARVRLAAVRSLGTRGDRRAVPALISCLRNGDDEFRTNVIAALAQMPDERAFNPLVVALFEESDDIRRNAAAAIGRLHDSRAFEPLRALLGDSCAAVRSNAAWALGELGDMRADEYLIRLLEIETEDEARSNALIALGNLATPAACHRIYIEVVDAHAHPRSRISAILAAVHAVEQRTKARNASPSSHQTGEMVAVTARSLLIALHRPLLEMLRDATDDELRATAAWALGHLPLEPSRRSVMTERLIAALDDPYHWVRAYAVESLYLLGDDGALESIERVRDRSDDDELVQLAERVIDDWDTPSSASGDCRSREQRKSY